MSGPNVNLDGSSFQKAMQPILQSLTDLRAALLAVDSTSTGKLSAEMRNLHNQMQGTVISLQKTFKDLPAEFDKVLNAGAGKNKATAKKVGKEVGEALGDSAVATVAAQRQRVQAAYQKLVDGGKNVKNFQLSIPALQKFKENRATLYPADQLRLATFNDQATRSKDVLAIAARALKEEAALAAERAAMVARAGTGLAALRAQLGDADTAAQLRAGQGQFKIQRLLSREEASTADERLAIVARAGKGLAALRATLADSDSAAQLRAAQGQFKIQRVLTREEASTADERLALVARAGKGLAALRAQLGDADTAAQLRAGQGQFKIQRLLSREEASTAAERLALVARAGKNLAALRLKLAAEDLAAQKAAARLANAGIDKNAAFGAMSRGGQLTRATRVAGALSGNMAESDAIARYGSAAVLAARNLDQFRGAADKAPASLKNLNAALRDGHSAARGLASGFGAMWLTWGAIAPLLAGAAISNAFTSAIKKGKEFEQQMATIRFLGEESAASVEKLGTRALDLARTGVKGPVEIATALKTLSLAGLNAEQQLAALKPVMNFSVAGEIELNKAAESLVGIATAYGYSAQGFGAVSDIVAKAAAISMSSVDSMTESFKQASTVAQQYGVTLGDSATVLALLSQIGIRGTAAGTSMRNMYNELMGSSKRAEAVLAGTFKTNIFDNATKRVRPMVDIVKSLSKELAGMTFEKQQKALQALGNERGLKALSAVLTALNMKANNIGQGLESRLEEIQKLLEDAPGFAALAAAGMAQTTSNQIKGVFASLEAALVESFMRISPQVNATAREIREIFNSAQFQSGISGLISGISTAVSTLVEYRGAIGTLLQVYVAWKTLSIAAALWQGALNMQQGIGVAINRALGVQTLATAAAQGAGAAAAGSLAATQGALGLTQAAGAATAGTLAAGQTAVAGAQGAAALTAGTLAAGQTAVGVSSKAAALGIYAVRAALGPLSILLGIAGAAWLAYNAAKGGKSSEQAAEEDAFTRIAGPLTDEITRIQRDTKAALAARNGVYVSGAEALGQVEDLTKDHVKVMSRAQAELTRAQEDGAKARSTLTKVAAARDIAAAQANVDALKKSQKLQIDAIKGFQLKVKTDSAKLAEIAFEDAQNNRNFPTGGDGDLTTLRPGAAARARREKEEADSLQKKIDNFFKGNDIIEKGLAETLKEQESKEKLSLALRLTTQEQFDAAVEKSRADSVAERLKMLADEQEAANGFAEELRAAYAEKPQNDGNTAALNTALAGLENRMADAKQKFDALSLDEQNRIRDRIGDQAKGINTALDDLKKFQQAQKDDITLTREKLAFEETLEGLSERNTAIEIAGSKKRLEYRAEELKLEKTIAEYRASGGDARLLADAQAQLDALAASAGPAIESARGEAAKLFDKKTQEDIAKSLGDALEAGFTKGEGLVDSLKKTLEAAFKKMVLRPVIDAFVKPMSQTMAGFASGGGGGGIGGLSNIASLASNASSMVTIGGQVAAGTMSIANALGTITANATGTGISGLLATNGAYGTAAGAAGSAGGISGAMAAIPGWGWAAMAAVAIAAILSKKTPGEQHMGGFASTAGRTGFDAAAAITLSRGGETRDLIDRSSPELQTAVALGAKTVVSNLTTMADTLGQKMALSLDLGFAANSNGKAGNKNAFGYFGISENGQMLKTSQNREMGEDAPAAFEKLLSDATEAMAKQILVGNEVLIRLGDTAAGTLTRLSSSLSTVNGAFDSLGHTLYEASLSGADAASAFADAFGGLDAFASATASYYEAFYSEQERTDTALRQLSTTLGKLGLALPDAAAEDALDQYRKLVDAQDLNTEAGRNSYAALVTLGSGFAQLASGAEQTATRLSLERQILELNGDTAALRLLDIAGMDAANIALFDRIALLTDEARVTQERNGLMTSLLQSLGNTGALRAEQLAGLDPSNRALQEQVFQIEDAKVALTKALAAESESAQAAQQAASERVSTIKSIFDTLKSNVQSLYETVEATKMQGAQQANAFIDNALANARATGYLPESDALVDAIAGARGGLDKQYASDFERKRDTLVLAGKLAELQDIIISGGQLTIAERQLKAAEDQLDALGNMRKQGQDLLDSLSGNTTATLSIVDAIAGLSAAVLAAQATSAAAIAAASTRSSSGSSGALGAGYVTSPVVGGSHTGIGDSGYRLDGNTLYFPGGGSHSVDGAGGAQMLLDTYGLTQGGLNGTLIRTRAMGGYTPPGMTLVGEQGPELVNFKSPSMIYTAPQTQRMLGGNTGRLEALIEGLTNRVASLQTELVAIKTNTGQMAEQIDEVTEGGNAMRQRAVGVPA